VWAYPVSTSIGLLSGLRCFAKTSNRNYGEVTSAAHVVRAQFSTSHPPAPSTDLPTHLSMDTPLPVTPLDCITDLLEASISRGLLDAVSSPDKQRIRWCSGHNMESLWTPDIRRYHGTCQVGLGKTTNCFSTYGRSWGPNRTPPGYQATEVSTLQHAE